MSLKTSGDVHHLLFQDYKFNLENTAFLEQIAYLYYSINSGAKHVTETIRDTMRVFTAFPGFRSQYSLSVGKNITGQYGRSAASEHVSEHISFIGQKGLTFATLTLSNGPTQLKFSEDAKLLSPLEAIPVFEHALEHKESSVKEWRLDYLPGQQERESMRPMFELATFLYEMRRVLVDAPQNFKARVWKDDHGRVHLFLTQVNEPQFADERLNVHLTVQHPARFADIIFEHGLI